MSIKSTLSKLSESKRNSKKTEEKKQPFEERPDLKKIKFYIIIVNYGQGQNIVKLLKANHASAQFVQFGEGTATKQVRNILSIEDNRKEIIYSFLREDLVNEFKKDLDAYFASSKRNAGVGFTIELDTIVGVKLYKFLTQTVRG